MFQNLFFLTTSDQCQKNSIYVYCILLLLFLYDLGKVIYIANHYLNPMKVLDFVASVFQ